MDLDTGSGVSSGAEEYDPEPIINELRREIDQWRTLDSSQWGVTPETERLLKHWRHHDFLQGVRPFFCQIEAIETLIWLTEVAPKVGQRGNPSVNNGGGYRKAKPDVRFPYTQTGRQTRSFCNSLIIKIFPFLAQILLQTGRAVLGGPAPPSTEKRT